MLPPMSKPHRIATAAQLDQALAELAKADRRLAEVIARIFGRMKQKVVPFDPANLLAAEAVTLRACGLSAPKQKHMKTIAAAILDGLLDLKRVRRMADEDARAHLTAVKGIGPWTADIYLMSSLGRADIWPVGDVALQAAVARALGLRKRPNEKAMERLSKNWRPWRTVAARLLWIHEDALRREKREAQRAKAKRAKPAKKK